MTVTVKILLIATLILSIVIPLYYLIGEKNKKRYKRAIGTNIFFYFGAFIAAGIMLFSGTPVQAATRLQGLLQRGGIRLSCGRTVNRFIMCGRRYRRSKCSKRGAGSYQRGLQRAW